jgi:hypothetical protein
LSTDGLINSGVPQGSILGPLFFLVYINDICNCRLYIYADDCSLFLPVGPGDDPINSTQLLQEDIDILSVWSNNWKLTFKAEKCKEVIFHSTRQLPQRFDSLHLGNNLIPRG